MLKISNWLDVSIGPLGMSPGGKFTFAVLVLFSILALGICLNQGLEIFLSGRKRKSEDSWELIVLRWICTASPQVGILGTVLGIIDSFSSLGQTPGDTSLLLQGLGSALFTSALGLAIAIFYSLPYSYFKSLPSKKSLVDSEAGA